MSFSGLKINTADVFLYATLGIFFFVLFPLNLIQVQKYSATATGAAALPMILLMFLLSRWAGGRSIAFFPAFVVLASPCWARTSGRAKRRKPTAANTSASRR